METIDLTQPHPLAAGHRVVPCPAGPRLEAEVRRLLLERGFIGSQAVPLAELHHHLEAAALKLGSYYTNRVSASFYRLDAGFEAAYLELIRFVRELMPTDFLFQRQPVVRFHFPVPFPPAFTTRSGHRLQHHSDTMGGHPFAMVQAWLALTPCVGTSALQMSSVADGVAILGRFCRHLGFDPDKYFDSLATFQRRLDRDPELAEQVAKSCAPLEMQAHELVLFDPRSVHGGTENREPVTRVSLDFRFLPVEALERLRQSGMDRFHRRWVRGDLCHPQSAWELAG